MHIRTSGDTNHPWMIYNFLELEMTAIHRLVSSRHTKTRPLCKITGKPPIAIPQRRNFAPIRHAAHNTRGRPKTFFVFVECELMSKKRKLPSVHFCLASAALPQLPIGYFLQICMVWKAVISETVKWTWCDSNLRGWGSQEPGFDSLDLQTPQMEEEEKKRKI